MKIFLKMQEKVLRKSKTSVTGRGKKKQKKTGISLKNFVFFQYGKINHNFEASYRC
jgi:hypothetical protein